MQDNGIVSSRVQLSPGLIGQLHLWDNATILELIVVVVLEDLIAREGLSIGTSSNIVTHCSLLFQPVGEG